MSDRSGCFAFFCFAGSNRKPVVLITYQTVPAIHNTVYEEHFCVAPCFFYRVFARINKGEADVGIESPVMARYEL